MVDDICHTYNFYKPRMYRDNDRRDYLLLDRCKKRTSKKIHVAIKKQLQYIKRDLGYIDMFLEPENGAELFDKQSARLEVIKKVYEQQLYMYQNSVHSVPDRIYRNRTNLAYCKAKGIRLSGPALGRPKKNASSDKQTEYIDNADRIEVERAFSLAKRCYGLGRIMTKREDTTRSSIELSIVAMNVDHIAAASLPLNLISIFSKYSWQDNLPVYIQNSSLFSECSC